jgi:hypothetical protein
LRAAAIFALLALGAAPSSPVANGRIAGLEARLFYSETGKLSANVLDPKGKFAGWNTIIGEGDAKRAAEDVLIVVAVAARKQGLDALLLDRPLEIHAAVGSRTLAKRKLDNLVLPSRGATYAAMFLPGVGCAGTVTVTAWLGTEARKATLAMDCGE